MLKKVLIGLVALAIIGSIGAYSVYRSIKASLPQLITVKDYEPLLVTQVYDRNNKKIGEFFRERRTLVPYEKIPHNLVYAFLAAEDDQFFQHKGLNYQAILRATLANMRAGRSVQGGSTITQQVAKTLLLSPEKTLLRKFREAMLAQQMEDNLKKEEILYLYLNQIYFGQGAYGVEAASQTYYHKSVDKLTLAEMAILAGLPQAPSRYSPVTNPLRAKERQSYVLHRMGELNFVPKTESDAAVKQPVKVYVRENYEEYAPFFLETVRQQLVAQLGEDTVLDKGLKVYTSLDLDKQLTAQESVVNGLKELDKRQGYRGPVRQLASKDDIDKFLKDSRKKLIGDSTTERIILPDGKFSDIMPDKTGAPAAAAGSRFPTYLKVGQSTEVLVEKVDDANRLVFVRVADVQGVIDFETMTWARKPNTEKRWDLDTLKKPSDALKAGDVILAKVVAENFVPSHANATKNKKNAVPAPVMNFTGYIAFELDQEPVVEGSLLSFDQQSQDVLAMVGGYSFARTEFNRALQAARQTGSSFKAIVYASALDKGYNPASPIMDAPVVFEESDANKEDAEGQEEASTKTWKPENHSKSFGGEIILRNALVKSLNVPAVKVVEDVGVPWATDYAHRLGIFSPLNPDFTLVLGSSSVTLYEMTKVFSQLGRLGKRIRPLIIHRVENQEGQKILDEVSLDVRFNKEISELDQQFDKRRDDYFAKIKTLTPEQLKEEKEKSKKADPYFFFDDKDQLIRPQTAYVMTSLLKGVIEDKNGTGGRAKAIGREVAGKTGTTNGYFDAWFIGYTPQISTGVWVGFDKEHSLGKGEVGGRAALPIWVEYMKAAHEGLPQMTFPVPDGIVFANIDSETGKLATAGTKSVLRQAFVEGTEPTEASNKSEEATDFLKQDLSQ